MRGRSAGAPGPGSDVRAQQALVALERNRAEVRAAFAPRPATGADGFPRSATFRWLSRHVSARALVSTAASAALTRMPLGRVLGSLLFKRGA